MIRKVVLWLLGKLELILMERDNIGKRDGNERKKRTSIEAFFRHWFALHADKGH